MAKLPVLSGAQVVRALQYLGFVVARQRGSHIVIRRGSSGCVVPNHTELDDAEKMLILCVLNIVETIAYAIHDGVTTHRV